MTKFEARQHHQALRAHIDGMAKDAPQRIWLVRSYNAMLALFKENAELWDEICSQDAPY